MIFSNKSFYSLYLWRESMYTSWFTSKQYLLKASLSFKAERLYNNSNGKTIQRLCCPENINSPSVIRTITRTSQLQGKKKRAEQILLPLNFKQTANSRKKIKQHVIEVSKNICPIRLSSSRYKQIFLKITLTKTTDYFFQDTRG